MMIERRSGGTEDVRVDGLYGVPSTRMLFDFRLGVVGRTRDPGMSLENRASSRRHHPRPGVGVNSLHFEQSCQGRSTSASYLASGKLQFP
jgi:hypothetical protein